MGRVFVMKEHLLNGTKLMAGSISWKHDKGVLKLTFILQLVYGFPK